LRVWPIPFNPRTYFDVPSCELQSRLELCHSDDPSDRSSPPPCGLSSLFSYSYKVHIPRIAGREPKETFTGDMGVTKAGLPLPWSKFFQVDIGTKTFATHPPNHFLRLPPVREDFCIYEHFQICLFFPHYPVSPQSGEAQNFSPGHI